MFNKRAPMYHRFSKQHSPGLEFKFFPSPNQSSRLPSALLFYL